MCYVIDGKETDEETSIDRYVGRYTGAGLDKRLFATSETLAEVKIIVSVNSSTPFKQTSDVIKSMIKEV